MITLVRFCAVMGLIISAAPYAEESLNGNAVTHCEGCPEMVALPAGSAMLGVEPFEANKKRGDMPLRNVTISYRFAVARTEITRAQFRLFVEDSGYELARNGCNTWSNNRILGYVREHTWDRPGYPQNEQHPVVCVSHVDATAYAAWLTKRTGQPYRLLSSTEFEYATRAGTRGPWFWGSANADACEYANVADAVFRVNFGLSPVFNCDDGYEYTAPVGSFKANAWGLHDMLGNAWEWTDDCFHPDPANVPVDGSAWLAEDGGECQRRTPRGGSWVSGTDWVRAAAQSIDREAYHSQLLGFRVGLTLPEKNR
ncbi:MAG: SUMF1/EgtB/PvdO family nonheme iron enzyme [Pseudomonadota bacterium]